MRKSWTDNGFFFVPSPKKLQLRLAQEGGTGVQQLAHDMVMSVNRTEGILRWRHALTAMISLYLSLFCEVIPPLLPKSILLPSVSFSTLHFPRKASFFIPLPSLSFLALPLSKEAKKEKNSTKRGEKLLYCTEASRAGAGSLFSFSPVSTKSRVPSCSFLFLPPPFSQVITLL